MWGVEALATGGSTEPKRGVFRVSRVAIVIMALGRDVVLNGYLDPEGVW